VESTGQLGQVAMDWMKKVKEAQQGEEKFVSSFIFMSQLGALIARFNAKMTVRWSKAIIKTMNPSRIL
jgi:hypothetical protein